MPNYFYTVFVPKFGHNYKSYSLYSKEYERKLQIYFWLLVLVTLLSAGYHGWSLYFCARNYRAFICHINQYSWSLYSVFFAFSGICGLILHYGNEDINRDAADYQTGTFYELHAQDYLETDSEESLG